MTLHPAPRPRGVPARAALEFVRPELVPPTQRAKARVPFVVPDGPRRFDGSFQAAERGAEDQVQEVHRRQIYPPESINQSHMSLSAADVPATWRNQPRDGARRCTKSTDERRSLRRVRGTGVPRKEKAFRAQERGRGRPVGLRRFSPRGTRLCGPIAGCVRRAAGAVQRGPPNRGPRSVRPRWG